MSFESDVQAFAQNIQDRVQLTFVNTAVAVQSSIKFGSTITASPGQPVGQYGPGYNEGRVGGTLQASWQLTFPSIGNARISSYLPYAPVIEEGIGKYGPLRLRSTVGGFHSVALTVAGFHRLLAAEAMKVFNAG